MRRGGTEHVVACAVVCQVLATVRASSHLAAGRPYLLCAHNDGIIEEFHSAARVVHLSLECTATLCQSPFQHPVRFHPIFFDLEMTRFLFRPHWGVFCCAGPAFLLSPSCPLRCCCLLPLRSCSPSPCHNLSHTCRRTCLPPARAGLRRQQFCSLCSCTFFNVCILRRSIRLCAVLISF